MAKSPAKNPASKPRRMSPLARKGLALRREILGPENVDAAMAETRDDDFMMMFFDATHEWCFGTVWSRPGLDRKTRSMLTLAIAASNGQTGAVRRHIRSALRAGLSKQEIGEIFLHVYVYAGVYNSLSAFTAAKEEFEIIAREERDARAAARAAKAKAKPKTTAKKPARRSKA